MREDDQGSGSGRMPQGACQTKRRDLHISRESARLSLVLTITVESGDWLHDRVTPFERENYPLGEELALIGIKGRPTHRASLY
jgi:hypothetical protein